MNMSVRKLLLWEKWRPKTMDDIILLPRIKNHFKNGLEGNYIFYGNFGTGKTSLARILIGLYTKDKPYLEINSSIETSINVLRSEIDDFCKFTPMMESESDYKYVFLDEFDRTSAEFQDAFKAFIEKYSKRGVRFIITTNHINKIDGGIKSRIPQINFDCINKSEEKFIKQEIYRRIKGAILPKEGFDIPKEDLISIITKKFPDFRSIMVDVEIYRDTEQTPGDNNLSTSAKLDFYEMIYNKDLDYDKIYHYIMSNFGPEKIDTMIEVLGRPFIDWSISEEKNIDKLFECNYIIADYSDKLKTNTDPVVLAMTIVGKFRDILL
jgi:DNA polymerase III delta prime subunit